MKGEIDFTLKHCCDCGTPFYMTTSIYNRRYRDHTVFYCPNGHGQSFTGKTEEQKLREQLAAVEKNKDYYQGEADRQRRNREQVERRLSAMKGQVTKANNKLKKGTCPCCEEQFPDLEIHIKAQHPDFDIDQSGTTDPIFATPGTPPATKKRARPMKTETAGVVK